MIKNIPTPSDKRIAIRVTSQAERAVRSGHPWLFNKAIQYQSHNGRCGDLAVIFDNKRRFMAIGLYDPDSPMRVRILQHRKSATIDREWFRGKIDTAVTLRASLQTDQTNACRLVHGENDGMPGFVLDRYDQTVVLKLYTAAWIPHLNPVLEAILSKINPERVVLRLSRQMQKQPDLLFGLTDGMVLHGARVTAPVPFRENGLKFTADVLKGQKTGFFLDQRENRSRVGDLTRGKSVLNVFAYSGGFSLYSARGGASRVVSLDISQPALEAAKYHFEINQDKTAVVNTAHQTLAGDAFFLLKSLRKQGERFDIVILDPPSFAKRQADVEKGLNAYARLARLGLGVLNRGGMLVAASCSSRVSAQDFFDVVKWVAIEEKRPLHNIQYTYHPLDHPIGFKEGAYLKCLFGES